MEPETQRRIEEAVIDVLRRANLEDMTEFKVRGMASVRLGIDLSDIHHKAFVRGIVESFLLSDLHADNQGNSNGSILEETKEVVQEEREPSPLTKDPDSQRNPVICKLSNKRNVMIQDINGKSLVWIGEFYQKDGKQLPSHKGNQTSRTLLHFDTLMVKRNVTF
uniref:Uncharacterized protein MANES_05G022100 n=1 Tax=Rhizophora mucronata TaxID=61149 RepID=A0A2P2JIK2_RHIMU